RLRSLRKDSQIASGLVNASVHIAATSRSVTLDSASNGPRGSLFTVRAGCRTDAGGLPVGCGSDAIGFESSAGFVRRGPSEARCHRRLPPPGSDAADEGAPSVEAGAVEHDLVWDFAGCGWTRLHVRAPSDSPGEVGLLPGIDAGLSD